MIRIISGTHKGRRILAPKQLPVRPTTDYAKESLFNILGNHYDFTELRVLDLFSGTGAIAYELASRGCTDITAVDNNIHCWKFINHTKNELGFGDVIRVVKANAFSFLKSPPGTGYDLIFADPPFEMNNTGEIPKLVFAQPWLRPGGRLVVEHPAKPGLPRSEQFLEQRTYGNVNFSIFGNVENT
jgi:16S rRNA (guanine(966)-N(2))-methyltransferase RsmD